MTSDVLSQRVTDEIMRLKAENERLLAENAALRTAITTGKEALGKVAETSDAVLVAIRNYQR